MLLIYHSVQKNVPLVRYLLNPIVNCIYKIMNKKKKLKKKKVLTWSLYEV